VLRLERLAEDLIVEHGDLGALLDAFLAALDAARPELAAVKSVIAYRSGLDIGQPEAREAADALGQVGPGRLTSKPVLDALFGVAADWAAGHGLPLHLHTGFGDRDLDLRLANPLHLRPLLESGRLGGRAPLVLLHASYPYVREAAYLASVYPNVYVDLSQVSPLLAGPALTHVLHDLLGLAPVDRLLYGSDAWGIPDWLWLAARATRRALAEALAWLPAAEATWAARRILHHNAEELYHLPSREPRG
jgi:predicted TIM-barrel fold metal-dependent hydrolase